MSPTSYQTAPPRGGPPNIALCPPHGTDIHHPQIARKPTRAHRFGGPRGGRLGGRSAAVARRAPGSRAGRRGHRHAADGAGRRRAPRRAARPQGGLQLRGRQRQHRPRRRGGARDRRRRHPRRPDRRDGRPRLGPHAGRGPRHRGSGGRRARRPLADLGAAGVDRPRRARRVAAGRRRRPDRPGRRQARIGLRHAGPDRGHRRRPGGDAAGRRLRVAARAADGVDAGSDRRASSSRR